MISLLLLDSLLHSSAGLFLSNKTFIFKSMPFLVNMSYYSHANQFPLLGLCHLSILVAHAATSLGFLPSLFSLFPLTVLFFILGTDRPWLSHVLVGF